MISVIIPHWPFNDEINKLLKKCVESFQADEIIIVTNEGTGFAKNVNIGLHLAKGDYLCVINNDLFVAKGELRQLCKDNAIVSPVVNGTAQRFYGCFFCMSRKVYERVGDFDEQFEIGYYEDEDYLKRLDNAKVEVISCGDVLVRGLSGTTMKRFNRTELMETNRQKFIEKWKPKIVCD